MSVYDAMYFLRDCRVQSYLKFDRTCEVIPMEWLPREHEIIFVQRYCSSSSFPFEFPKNQLTYEKHPDYVTPIAGLLYRKLTADSPEECDDQTHTSRKDVIAVLSHYWKSAAREFARVAVDHESKAVHFCLLGSDYRDVINISMENPNVMLQRVLSNMSANPTIRQWFYMYFEAVGERNKDVKWLKLLSLMEVIGKHQRLLGRGTRDVKQSMRRLYELTDFARPAKRNAHDGIDVAYQHRHCSAHWGGCDPNRVPQCVEWCRLWLPEADALLDGLESDVWFFLLRADQLAT